MEQSHKITLVVSVGTSPKVITSTIQALINEKSIIPDEIIAITTSLGKESIVKDIIEQDEINKLVKTFDKKNSSFKDKLKFGSSDSIKVLGDGSNDFKDISNLDECNAAAEQILKIFRQYTSTPDNKLLICIAGGRKSLSALMFSCMTLVGRAQDQIFHVFIDENSNKKNNSPILAEMNYVRTRNLIEKRLKSGVPSYDALVKELQHNLDEKIDFVNIDILINQKSNTYTLNINNQKVILNYDKFSFLLLFCILIKTKKLSSDGWNGFKKFDEEKNEFGFLHKWIKCKSIIKAKWFDDFCIYAEKTLLHKWDTPNNNIKSCANITRKEISVYLANEDHKNKIIPRVNVKHSPESLYPSEKINIKPKSIYDKICQCMELI